MNINLDRHTQEVINDFMAIDPVIGEVIKLAAEVSYMKGMQDQIDKNNNFMLDIKGQVMSEVI